MGFLKGFVAVVAGTLLALIVGSTFEYFNSYYKFLPVATDRFFFYPAIAGIGGFLASFLAVIICSVGRRAAPEAPKRVLVPPVAKRKVPPQPAKEAGPPERLDLKESKEVPGMPTFDVKKPPTMEPPAAKPGKEQEK